ncbi:MAG: SEC-C metal-binding domain-containing protein [Bacillota bacterium]|jgi:hypothetical protein
MDERIDQKTKDTLLNALESAKAYSQKMRDKQERRLWKKFNRIPCDLSDAINRLTKDEMDNIRKKLSFNNLSSLRKAELAAELVRLIPMKFKEVLSYLDQGRYGLIKLIAQNSGVITGYDMKTRAAEALLGYSLVFPGVNNNDQKVLCLPQELVDTFWQVDTPELEKIVRRNTEWVLLTHGMLYYYGVASPWFINWKISQLTGQDIDFREYINVMSVAMDHYGQVRWSSFGFCDHRVFDAKKIIEEHSMRDNVDYYPFTKQQLLKAGEPDYIDRSPAMNDLISFLLQYYELNNEETDEIALQLINLINLDAKSTAIIEYLNSWFEFPSFDFVRQLTSKITDLHNNTRQWVLKGHTPNELFQEEKKHLRPLPTEPFQLGQTDSKVIDLKTRTKVGRNDPCPCGSGKKYKKCCGK